MKYNAQVNGPVGTAAGAITSITYYPQNDQEDELLWKWHEKKMPGVRVYYAPRYDGKTWGLHGLRIEVDAIDNTFGVPTRGKRNPAYAGIEAALAAAGVVPERCDRPGGGRWMPWPR